MNTNTESTILSFNVPLSRVLKTINNILPDYRLESLSEILDRSYVDEMNHTILMDLSSCLIENYRKNSELAWMGEFYNKSITTYKSVFEDLPDAEEQMKDMFNTLLTSVPENFDCEIKDNWEILYDLYSPDSSFCYMEE